MNLKRYALMAATFGLPLFAVADGYPRPKMELKVADYDIKFRDFNFPSGLRVIFQQDSSQPVVSITYVNDRGSTADPAGKEGIAHLVEHLWFRSHQIGPDGKPLPKVWDMLEQMGASLNAFTADDQTVYMTMAPKEYLPDLLRLERLRMISAIEGVQEDVAIIERDVVRNELRMRYENSTGAAFGYMMVKLFPQTHPYGKAAYAGIGNHESLNAIKLADIQQFVKENYGPDKTTLLIAGDINLDDGWKLISENLGYDVLVDPKNPTAKLEPMQPKPHLPKVSMEEIPPVQAAETNGEVNGVTTERGPVEDPFVMIGWSLPPGWSKDDMLMNVAVNSLWPAIYQELNPSWDPTSADLPTSGGCGMNGQVYATAAYCFIEIKKGEDGTDYVEKALDGLYRVWQNTDDEILKKYQDYYFNYGKNASMAFIFQGVDLSLSLFSDQATQAAMFAHYTGDLQYYSRQFEAISKVDRKQMQGFAEKYLNRKRAVALVMQPYEEGDIVLDSSNSQYRGGNRADGAEAMDGAEKLTSEIIVNAVKRPDVSRVKQEKLANGAEATVMPYSSSPLVQIAINFKGGGASNFPKGHFDFASNMWIDKSYATDTLAIAGFDGMTFGATSTGLSISASVANTEEALFVLRERLENLQPYTSGKLDWVASNKKVLWANMKLPEYWAETTQMERLVPGHYLSEWLDHGEMDALKKLGLDQVSNVFANVFRPENASVLVVGNVDATQTLDLVKTYMGGWAGWGKVPDAANKVELRTTYPDFPAPPERQVILFNKKLSSQSNVTYSCQLAKTDAAGEAAAQVMSDVLDGRAWLALREQTGASYGANAYAPIYPGGMGMLGMGSLVQNDYSAKAVQAFLGLGEDAKAGKLDSLMIATKKFKIAQNFVIFQQSTEMMLGRIMGLIRLGRPLDYHATWASNLANATIPQMQKLMDPCVGHEVVTVVGPVEVIEPYFKESGLKYEVYDWEKARVDYATKYKIKLPKAKDESKDKK